MNALYKKSCDDYGNGPYSVEKNYAAKSDCLTRVSV
jgi:hypothetical protein